MPNWVYNTLTIDGDKTETECLMAQVSAPYVRKTHVFRKGEGLVWEDVNVETNFSFWNIVRPPDDKLEEYYTGDNWYGWNCAAWGTKWDVDAEKIHEGDSLMYRFDSAWSPPVEAIDALSKQYPHLTFHLSYQEEQGWGGELVSIAGQHVTIEEWDIPESHEEMLEHNDQCWCETFGEPAFEDCPVQSTEQKEA